MDENQYTVEKVRYEYILNSYQDLDVLSQEDSLRTVLAKNVLDGRLVVKKWMPAAQGAVYEKLVGREHPNLAPVWDVAYEEGTCVVVQEYISGISLKELLRQGKTFSEKEMLHIVLSVLDAAQWLHRQGLVHRDIHPGNVLISSDNVVKLLDLGIARTVKPQKDRDTEILGTVGFAAPEQFGFAQTDARTDIYSIGVLMKRLLTAEEDEALVPDRWRDIVHKCTMISPQERYRSVQELREAILSKGGRRRDGAMPGGSTGRGVPGFRTGKTWKKVIAVAGYVLMGMFTLGLWADGAMKKGVLGLFYETGALLLMVWLPFAVCSNWGNWDRRLPPFSHWDKDVTVAVRIVVPFLLIYGGMALDSYVRG